MSLYSEHVARWKDCRGCSLCERRNRVVLARGKLPCDVLFIGEAPGESEDTLGQPFIGPAGKLLDWLIEQAGGADHRIAFTNLIACIPRDETGKKVIDPPKEAIDACRDRLIEILSIACPSVVVYVGKASQKYGPEAVKQAEDWESPIYRKEPYRADIIHPAAILRVDISQRGLTIQQTILKLENAFGSQVPF